MLELVLRVGGSLGPVLTYGELKAQFADQAALPSAIEIDRARKRLAKGEDIDTVLDALSRGLAQKIAR